MADEGDEAKGCSRARRAQGAVVVVKVVEEFAVVVEGAGFGAGRWVVLSWWVVGAGGVLAAAAAAAGGFEGDAPICSGARGRYGQRRERPRAREQARRSPGGAQEEACYHVHVRLRGDRRCCCQRATDACRVLRRAGSTGVSMSVSVSMSISISIPMPMTLLLSSSSRRQCRCCCCARERQRREVGARRACICSQQRQSGDGGCRRKMKQLLRFAHQGLSSRPSPCAARDAGAESETAQRVPLNAPHSHSRVADDTRMLVACCAGQSTPI
jgi:hypothetical protein